MINYSKVSLKDALKELTGGKGADVVYDPVGGDLSEPAVNLQNIHELWALFAEDKLKPVVTDLFALEEYESACACMMERRAGGKVILTI